MKKSRTILLSVLVSLILFLGCASSTYKTHREYEKKISSKKSITWEKTYGEAKHDLISQDAILFENGDILVLANRFINDFESFVVLLKLNKYGDKLWEKTYGKKLNKTRAYSFLLDDNKKNIYIIGMQESMTESKNAYILKVDLQGEVISQKVIKRESATDFRKIAKLDNGYIVAGSIVKKIVKQNLFDKKVKKNLFLVKFNKVDKIVWEKNQNFDLKNIDDIYVTNIVVNNRDIDLYANLTDGYPLKFKYDENGTFKSVNFLLDKYSSDIFFNDVKVVNRNTIAIGRKFDRIFCYIDDYRRTYYKDKDRFGEGTSIDIVNDTEYITTGSFIPKDKRDYDIFLLKVNKSDRVWLRKYGGSSNDWAKKVISLANGGFLIIGTSRSYSSNNVANIFVLKVNRDGLID